MKKLLFVSVTLLMTALPAYAGTITRGVAPKEPKDTVGNYYVASPTDIANAQFAANKKIEYILENYSDKELARYVRNLNENDIAYARRQGTSQPRRLHDSELKDRNKMREYLRSRFKFTY